ncbi:MAG: GNAT family N-acetyltransferase [Polaromonas sp.]
MMTDGPIETARLQLRNLTSADVTECYLSWLSDPEVLRYLEVRFSKPGSLEELGAFVKNVNDSTDTLMFGIFRKDTGRHIGNIKLGPLKFEHARAEIGFLIGDRSSWGAGYASEAIQAVAQFGLDHLKLVKIGAGCYETNVGSMKALLKAGFLQVATIPNDVVSDGVRVASLLFAKNR